MSERIPTYVLDAANVSTQRAWRRMKRAEIRAVRKAWQKFRWGCVFVPGYEGVQKVISERLDILENLMSPREWGS